MKVTLLLLAAAALPAAEFSAYIGDENTWHISRAIVDSSGNTYVAGSRTFNLSMDPLRPDLASEAIVAKLDSSGKTVLFAALGGKGSDVANDVAIDRAGNIYLAGSTTSPNFPVRNALYPGAAAGFVAKFNPDASEVLYSTYFPERIEGLAVDAAGAVFVTGTTLSRSFPVTPGLPAGPVGGGVPMVSGAFLTKIAPAGDRIVYSAVISGQQKNCGAGSSCFLSSRGARGVAVALDAAGNAYLAGNSDVSDLPVTPGVVTPNGAGAFVAKVNAAGTALAYLTYLGTGGQVLTPFFTPANTVRALAVDAAGDAYVAGATFDPHLPVTPGAFQTTFHGWQTIENLAPIPPNDAFALKLNPAGSAILWGSYLGGDGSDTATSATLDPQGNLWVSGSTNSTGFPNADGWSTGEDFIVRFDASGRLPYSARYPGGTTSQTLAADPAGLLHVATPDGMISAIVPSPRPMMRPWSVGPSNGHIAAGEVISIYGPHLAGGVFVNDIAAPVLYASDQQINAVVPFEVEGRTRARLRVGGGPEIDVAVLTSVPQIFAPAVNQDGSLNSAQNPAPAGSVMTIWVTGATPPFPAVPDGQVATGAQAYFVGQLYAASTPVRILYAGAAPGLVAGVAQINFVVPDSGSVVLTVGKYASAPLFISVKPQATPRPDPSL